MSIRTCHSNIVQSTTSIDTPHTLSCLLYDINGSSLPVNVLFDTGALSGDFASSQLAARARACFTAPAHQTELEVSLSSNYLINGLPPTLASLHENGVAATLAINNSTVSCYGFVCACVRTDSKINRSSVTFELPQLDFQVIDMDYDIIIGRQSMTQHCLYDSLRPHFMEPLCDGNPTQIGALSIRAASLRSAQYKAVMQIHQLSSGMSTRKCSDDAPSPGSAPTSDGATRLVKHAVSHISSLLSIVDDEDPEDFPMPLSYCPEMDLERAADAPPIRLIDLIEIGGNADVKRRTRLLVEEFEHIFCDRVSPEPANFPPMVLAVDESKWCVPRNQGPPRFNSRERNDLINRKTQILLDLKVIEPSQAPYYSHIHLVKKPNSANLPLDKQLREVHDYRNLNDATTSGEGWPLPNITHMIRCVGEARPKLFGVSDAVSGYHQAPLDVASRPFTAFITQMGLYQYMRVPMGLKGAVSYFQRALATTIFAGLLYVICMLYIDDVLVYGSTDDVFLDNLRTVFQRVSDHNARLNPRKSRFAVESVEFTGHTLTSEGVSFSRSKIQDVLDFPRPTTMKQLKGFLGLVNYFRDHIVGCSDMLRPLHAMTLNYVRNKSLGMWSEEATNAYDRVKKAIEDLPMLFFLDDDSPIVLQTDASDYGIGAYLFQVRNIDGVMLERPVFILSKSLTDVQCRWHTPEKEAYAIYHALVKLRHLLIDRKFLVQTDHRNLTYLDVGISPKILRWKQAVAEYDFDVEHIPGSSNIVADALSRLVRPLPRSSPNSPLVLDVNLLGGRAPQRVLSDENRGLISQVHNSMIGHHGVERTHDKLVRMGHSWMGMRFDIRQFIRECSYCQCGSLIHPAIKAVPYTLATFAPMEMLQVDTIGPLPEDANGCKYVVAIIDCFTRWVEFYPAPTCSAEEAASALFQHAGRYGNARCIMSDNGSQFVNETCDALCELMGTARRFTSPYSHEQNGIVERLNREFGRHLRGLLFDQKVVEIWSFKFLPIIQRICNNSVHTSTGVSPAQLLFGDCLNLDRNILYQPAELSNTPATTIRTYFDRFLAAQAVLLRAAFKHQLALDEYHVKVRKDPTLVAPRKRKSSPSTPDEVTTFPTDSYVLYRNHARTSKLTNPYRGPFRVVAEQPDGDYLLQELLSGKTLRAHVQHLRPFLYNLEDADAPVFAATRNAGEWQLESISAHRGDPKVRNSLEFHVKWAGYPSAYDTWEPWKGLRATRVLEEYLLTVPSLVYLVASRDRPPELRAVPRVRRAPSQDAPRESQARATRGRLK